MEELERIMGRIRERWPATRIRIRADAGFCRDGILSWCEANAVGYVLGLARNPVLTWRLRHAMRRARRCAASEVALFSWTPKIAWIGRDCSLERRG